MRVIWTENVKSAERRDKRTGQPIEYRLTVFDTGEASCSCPGFIFQSVNNPKVSAEDKLRYRCKHLSTAFATHDFGGQEVAETSTAPAPAGSPTSRPPRAAPSGLWLDDEDDAPRIRRR